MSPCRFVKFKVKMKCDMNLRYSAVHAECSNMQRRGRGEVGNTAAWSGTQPWYKGLDSDNLKPII